MEYSIISANNLNDLRKKINKAKDLVIVEGGDENINRAIVENVKVDILLSPEKNTKEDKLYVRSSGLNHVLCKLANKNKITIGFNFNDVLESKERDVLIGRMMQNVRLCRKFKVSMVFDCFGKYKVRKENLVSFARVLGMNPGEAKKALNFEKIDKRKVKVIN